MQYFKVTVNGKTFDVNVEEIQNGAAPASPAPAGQAPPAPAPVQTASAPVAVGAGEEPIKAPLAGTIMAIKVKPGEEVKEGQVLLTLEALKMENEIVAPQAGVVKDVYAQSGATVNVGDILLTLRSL
ncbi:MAG TPA: biotin/lipoyl-containing protein [Bacillota bacterium]